MNNNVYNSKEIRNKSNDLAHGKRKDLVHGKRKEDSISKFVKQEKNPNDMFMEPIHVGQCPLCEGNTYSENDPSNDPSMSIRCCKCTWWENQFLTWEEMNDMIDEFSNSVEKGIIPEQRTEEEYDNFGEHFVVGETRGEEIVEALSDVREKEEEGDK